MMRSGNILGVFDLKEDADVSFKRVLLCDDIKTTGSTLNECAKTLLIGGAAEVFCVTAAVTEKETEPKETKDLSPDW
jgi:predicted amidophosphoribosyltransferase